MDTTERTIDNYPILKEIIKEWETREELAQQKYDELKSKDKNEVPIELRVIREKVLYLIGNFRLDLVKIQMELADLRLVEIKNKKTI